MTTSYSSLIVLIVLFITILIGLIVIVSYWFGQQKKKSKDDPKDDINESLKSSDPVNENEHKPLETFEGSNKVIEDIKKDHDIIQKSVDKILNDAQKKLLDNQ